jgi:uroporphyrinogen decarboxylase
MMRTETMTSRERIATILRHGVPDRIAMADSFWDSTLARWRREGLPAAIAPEEWLGLEFRWLDWDRTLQLPTETVEDATEYSVIRDGNGVVSQHWTSTSAYGFVDSLVKTPDDWRRYRHRLVASDSRIDWQALDREYRRWRSDGQFVVFSAMPGYEDVWRIAGPENTLMAMADDPDWVREMSDATAELAISMAKLLIDRGYELDGAWIWDDLGYRNGLLYGRRAYRELIMPAHRAICDYFHGSGLPVILHSCGNVNDALDLVVEAGFDCLQPMEVKAGMDVRKLKREWGDRLILMGNVDARLLGGDPDALEVEIRDKLAIAMAGGGYIYHSDHSVPDDVSLEAYLHALEIVRKYAWY